MENFKYGIIRKLSIRLLDFYKRNEGVDIEKNFILWWINNVWRIVGIWKVVC